MTRETVMLAEYGAALHYADLPAEVLQPGKERIAGTSEASESAMPSAS